MSQVKNNFNDIKEHLENLSDSDLLEFWILYCDKNNYVYDNVYENDEEFFSMYFSNSMEAVRAAMYGSYNLSDKYVMFDGQANLESSDYVDHLISIDDLTGDIEGNPEAYESLIEIVTQYEFNELESEE